MMIVTSGRHSEFPEWLSVGELIVTSLFARCIVMNEMFLFRQMHDISDL